jgi:hypothetical protein
MKNLLTNFFLLGVKTILHVISHWFNMGRECCRVAVAGHRAQRWSRELADLSLSQSSLKTKLEGAVRISSKNESDAFWWWMDRCRKSGYELARTRSKKVLKYASLKNDSYWNYFALRSWFRSNLVHTHGHEHEKEHVQCTHMNMSMKLSTVCEYVHVHVIYIYICMYMDIYMTYPWTWTRT